jgi:thiamine biosynthesis lipoprotein
VSVVVPTATEADALSTAFSLRPLPQIRDVVTVLRTAQAHIIEAGGTVIIRGA